MGGFPGGLPRLLVSLFVELTSNPPKESSTWLVMVGNPAVTLTFFESESRSAGTQLFQSVILRILNPSCVCEKKWLTSCESRVLDNGLVNSHRPSVCTVTGALEVKQEGWDCRETPNTYRSVCSLNLHYQGPGDRL